MRYMRDIGHFEFGPLHKPLSFDVKFCRQYELDDPNYWLAYWITCFEHVLERVPTVHLVTQDRIRRDPQNVMSKLLERIGVSHETDRDFRDDFIATGDDPKDRLFDAHLLKRARDTFQALDEQSVQ